MSIDPERDEPTTPPGPAAPRHSRTRVAITIAVIGTLAFIISLFDPLGLSSDDDHDDGDGLGPLTSAPAAL